MGVVIYWWVWLTCIDDSRQTGHLMPDLSFPMWAWSGEEVSMV